MSGNPQPLHSGEEEEPTSSRQDVQHQLRNVAGPSNAPPIQQEQADSDEPSTKRSRFSETRNLEEMVHNYKVAVDAAIQNIQKAFNDATLAIDNGSPFFNNMTEASRQEFTITQEFLEKINALRRVEVVPQVVRQVVQQGVPPVAQPVAPQVVPPVAQPVALRVALSVALPVAPQVVRQVVQQVNPPVAQPDVPQVVPPVAPPVAPQVEPQVVRQQIQQEVQHGVQQNDQEEDLQEMPHLVPEVVQEEVEANIPLNPPRVVPDPNVETATRVRVCMYYHDKMYYKNADRTSLMSWLEHLREFPILSRMYKFNDLLNQPLPGFGLLSHEEVTRFLTYKMWLYRHGPQVMLSLFSTLRALSLTPIFREAVRYDMSCLNNYIYEIPGRSNLEYDQLLWREIHFYIKGMLETRLMEYLVFCRDVYSVPSRTHGHEHIPRDILQFQLEFRGVPRPFRDGIFQRRLRFYRRDCFNSLQSAALLLYYKTIRRLTNRNSVLDLDFGWLSTLGQNDLVRNECHYFRIIFKYHTHLFAQYFVRFD